ncbi:uncharacterized protein LOC144079088 [Stigmatopora argus]
MQLHDQLTSTVGVRLEQVQDCLRLPSNETSRVQTRLKEPIRHQSVVQRTVMQLHDQLTSTVGVRLEQVQDCLRLPSNETSRAHKMVAKLQRQFATLKNRQKTELRSLFEEQ